MTTTAQTPSVHEGHRQVLAREFLASALYLNLVLLAAIAATPADTFPSDAQAVRLILGTSIGLLLAHWLAFRLASRATASGAFTTESAEEAGAQLAGGMGVAVLACLPFLVLDGSGAATVALMILAVILAVVGVVIGRQRGLAWWGGLLTGMGVLALAVVVVYVKSSGTH